MTDEEQPEKIMDGAAGDERQFEAVKSRTGELIRRAFALVSIMPGGEGVAMVRDSMISRHDLP